MPAVAACPPGTDVIKDIFTKSCGTCHGAAAPAQNLDLVSLGLGARMVNKPSTCLNRPLIDGMLEGESPTGLLFDKLSGSVTNCGVQMPAGAPALTPTEMACVKDWAVAAVNKALGR
jgi:cytochrome c peroxidase